MHRRQSHRRKAKHLKRKEGFMSSIKGVSHLSRRAKRRLYCKLQLWMWRQRRERCRFAIFKAKKRVSGISPGFGVKTQKKRSKVAPPVGCPEATIRGQDCLLKLCQPVSLSETLVASGSLHSLHMETNDFAGNISQPAAASPQTETLTQFSDPLKHSHTVKSKDGDAHTHVKESRMLLLAQSLDVEDPSGQIPTSPPGQDQASNAETEDRHSYEETQTDPSLKELTKDIDGFLDGFYRKYGSFIPLQKIDVMRHLKRKFNTDFNGRKNIIFTEATKCTTVILQKPVPSFQLVYKKHTLTLDDLSTLADQNWLNDQVMNMYGELIMESTNHKVHFLNSFFHRQLMTKGYDGVKRWTKQVDLFSKSLLLVPIHLEVHWCLVTADNVRKRICLYDSQGNALHKVARNILKYLMTEAKEKQQAAFENGWAVSFDEKIPQQTNENDCGVFVLEYSRCLALGNPLQFSQKDIPKIRKRIYKELCDCKLHDQG